MAFGDDAGDAFLGGRGDGDDDMVDFLFFGEMFDVFGGAGNFNAADVRADFGLSVVDDTDDASVELGVLVVGFVDDEFTSVASADEHGASGRFAAVETDFDDASEAEAEA